MNFSNEIGVILINHGLRPFPIQYGDRIGQLVFKYVPKINIKYVNDIVHTGRGEAGFGSTNND